MKSWQSISRLDTLMHNKQERELIGQVRKAPSKVHEARGGVRNMWLKVLAQT